MAVHGALPTAWGRRRTCHLLPGQRRRAPGGQGRPGRARRRRSLSNGKAAQAGHRLAVRGPGRRPSLPLRRPNRLAHPRSRRTGRGNTEPGAGRPGHSRADEPSRPVALWNQPGLAPGQPVPDRHPDGFQSGLPLTPDEVAPAPPCRQEPHDPLPRPVRATRSFRPGPGRPMRRGQALEYSPLCRD